VSEAKPAVEFADNNEDESTTPGWWALGGTALFTGAAAAWVAWPGMWQDQVVEYTGRKGRIISVALEAIGFWPALIILTTITAVTAVAAAISFIKWNRNQED